MKVVTLWAVCMLLAITTVVAAGAGPDSTDQNFVRKAAEGGMLEVKLGELAMRRAKSQKVKDFGKTMVSDHQKVNNELKDLAARSQITVPATIGKSMQQQYDSLAAVGTDQFDMLYMNMMIASHEQTIGLFQRQSNGGKDLALKKWADSKVPALKHHLEMAKGLFKPALGQ